jgi:catechol 2,3-dioxygenase-like lactoylglutathione lyase family enzyme
MKLSRVVIKVRDYRKSFEFYKDVLGLKLSSSWQRKDSWGALFSAGNAVVEILWLPSGVGLDECNYTIERNKIEVNLEVTDIDIWHRRLVAAGIAVDGPPRDVPWGFRLFTVKDPDNVPIVLAQPLET